MAGVVGATSAAQALIVNGTVTSATGVPVAGAAIFLDGTDSGVRTLRDGTFTVVIPDGGSTVVRPALATDSIVEAVSALDAAFALQVAVGKRELDSTSLVACDAGGDGRVTAVDAARILQLVVGRISALPAVGSCPDDLRFVPTDVPSEWTPVLPGAGSGCETGGVRVEGGTPGGQVHFVAVPIGDCSGDWDPPVPSPTPSWSPTSRASATPTSTPTSPPTATAVPSPTDTHAPTATATPVPTVTPTSSPTPAPTLTATASAAPTATPTPQCGPPPGWQVGTGIAVARHAGGRVWLPRPIPAGSGWGLFWLHQDPQNPGVATLWYAHMTAGGQVNAGPMPLIDVSRIAWRDRYYLAAWHTDHFGILIAERQTLYYYNLDPNGTLDRRRVVGPQLFVSSTFDQESDGDLDPFPGGFLGVIEGTCLGHSCSYAFRLAPDGTPTSPVMNLVDFDLTHAFYPRAAYDGEGFAVLTVKDIRIAEGGVGTKYMREGGSPGSRAKVIPSKEYLWDEFPDIAWNGDHFAAVWTENSGRNHDLPWQLRFASFRRDFFRSELIGQAILDTWPEKAGFEFTTQIHAAFGGWIVQYARYRTGAPPLAVYQWVDDRGAVLAETTPFELPDDVLGSGISPDGTSLGILHASADTAGTSAVWFHPLPLTSAASP